LLAFVGSAGAADVLISGGKLSLADNVANAAKRKAVFKSTDAGVGVGTGNPTVDGVTIEIVNPTPGIEQSDVFALPATGWVATGNPVNSYKYKDSALLNGPVKAAQIKNGKLVKFTAKGAQITFTLGVPQTQVGLVIGIGTERYCALFGGIITKDDGTKFNAKNAPAPAACPSLTPVSTTSTTATSLTTTSTSTSTTVSTTTSSSVSSTTSTTTTSTTLVPGSVDPNSAVLVTSNCLTNGTFAQLGVQVTLVDTNSTPIVGAAVAITSTAGLVSGVTASGNVYRAAVVGPGTGTSLQISVIANGTPLNTQPVITQAPAFNDLGGGAGGCPQDGNLRVRTVTELGIPIAGASVMVGQSEQANVYTTLFGLPANGANTATTDANGFATFRDFGSALSGPITITAGAANRAYVTLAGVDASDVVLPLKQVLPGGFSGTLNGDVNGISSSSNIRVGVVLGDVTLNTLASFNLTSLLADSACYNTGIAGNIALPNNVFIPNQTVVIFNVPKKPYVSAPLPFGTRRVVAIGGNIPVNALTGGDINAAISQLSFTNITAQTFNINAVGPTPNNFSVTNYDASTACTATGAPGTHAFCIAGMDWDGNTTPTHNVGEGALGVFSFKAGQTSGGAVNLTGVNYRSKGAGAPFNTVGHLGATVSLNLDKNAVPANVANGISAILKRDFPSDTFPGSFAYGAMYPIRSQTQSGRTLTLDTPAGLTGAQYVKHTLAQEVSVAYTACEANDSERTSRNPLWEVYAPQATASLTLPTLPASFPRATLGGNLPGLIDPTATADDDKIVWSTTTVREGLNGSFNYDGLRFSGFQKYGTQFTTNTADYVP
jgi:hypothetical protein